MRKYETLVQFSDLLHSFSGCQLCCIHLVMIVRFDLFGLAWVQNRLSGMRSVGVFSGGLTATSMVSDYGMRHGRCGACL